ncbi:hypothetical protein ACZ75_09145 [Massilia sp. NR 4-1]|nr:hypothetical protein ACZ75_09145 [Massilia sp. NR 4-1]
MTAGLFAASAPASADTTSLIFDADKNAGFHITHIPGASFVDDFLFSVEDMPHYPTGTAVVGKTWVDGARLANYSIDSIEFFHVDTGGGYTMLPTTVTSGLLEFYPEGALGPGSFGFRVSGHTLLAGMGGAYAGTLNLAPVPEPAAYLMLLIGVGLLAFTSKAKENDKLG